MEFARERELVHLRYELRSLLADGRPEEAGPLLARLRKLAMDEAGEVGAVRAELDRWASTFGL